MRSKVELLEKLAHLRRQNALTENEYQREKAEVLQGSNYADSPELPSPPHQVRKFESTLKYLRQRVDTFPHATDGESSGRKPGLKGLSRNLIGAIVLGLIALAAFFAIPGSPGSRAVAMAEWQSMGTPALEKEYWSANMTAMRDYLLCTNAEDAEAAQACENIEPVINDAIAMSEILCRRDATNKACAGGQNLKELLKNFHALAGIAQEIQQNVLSPPSYKPRI